MLFITLQNLPSFLTLSPKTFLPTLKPRQVPLSQWALQVVVFAAGSLLNNLVYAYHVPLTVQIVFRSAGEYECLILEILVVNEWPLHFDHGWHSCVPLSPIVSGFSQDGVLKE